MSSASSEVNSFQENSDTLRWRDANKFARQNSSCFYAVHAKCPSSCFLLFIRLGFPPPMHIFYHKRVRERFLAGSLRSIDAASALALSKRRNPPTRRRLNRHGDGFISYLDSCCVNVLPIVSHYFGWICFVGTFAHKVLSRDEKINLELFQEY